MQSKINKTDFILIGISIIAVVELMLHYWNITVPNKEIGTKDFEPYYEYNANKGIVLINSINTILWIGILLIGVLWIKRQNIEYKWI